MAASGASRGWCAVRRAAPTARRPLARPAILRRTLAINHTPLSKSRPPDCAARRQGDFSPIGGGAARAERLPRRRRRRWRRRRRGGGKGKAVARDEDDEDDDDDGRGGEQRGRKGGAGRGRRRRRRCASAWRGRRRLGCTTSSGWRRTGAWYEKSGGRCGYLHMADMEERGYGTFRGTIGARRVAGRRRFADLRGNEGGHVSSSSSTAAAGSPSSHRRTAAPPTCRTSRRRRTSSSSSTKRRARTARWSPPTSSAAGARSSARAWGGVYAMDTPARRRHDGLAPVVRLQIRNGGECLENNGVAPDTEVFLARRPCRRPPSARRRRRHRDAARRRQRRKRRGAPDRRRAAARAGRRRRARGRRRGNGKDCGGMPLSKFDLSCLSTSTQKPPASSCLLLLRLALSLASASCRLGPRAVSPSCHSTARSTSSAGSCPHARGG